MLKSLGKIILLNTVIVFATLGLGVGELFLVQLVKSHTYQLIFFFLLIVLYCNVVAKALVSLIRTYDKIA